MDGSYILPWECFDCFFDDECSLEQTRSSQTASGISTGTKEKTEPMRSRPLYPQLEEIIACGKRNHII